MNLEVILKEMREIKELLQVISSNLEQEKTIKIIQNVPPKKPKMTPYEYRHGKPFDED